MAPAPNNGHLRRCQCGGTPDKGGECAECRKKRLGLQRRAVGSGPDVAPPIVHDVLRSPGRPLDNATRGFMESRFNHDFSGVRVHTDGQAAESARAVNALAYTVGNHVAFNSGQYAPGTSRGRGLLAHELAHVIQQGDGGSTLQASLAIGSANNAYEREAQMAARQVAGDARPSLAPASSLRISTGPISLQRAASELCNAPAHFGIMPLHAAALGTFFHLFVEQDYISKMGVRRGVDAYFDTIELMPIDPTYAAFLIRNNPSLGAVQQVFLSVTPLKRPDLLVHKGPLMEFDEVKPDSITGVLDGVLKIHEIAGYMGLLGLPYRFGTTYTPTPKIPLFSTAIGGIPVAFSLKLSRKRPGLIVYELCIYTDWLRVTIAAALLALIIIIIILSRGKVRIPIPSPIPAPLPPPAPVPIPAPVPVPVPAVVP